MPLQLYDYSIWNWMHQSFDPSNIFLGVVAFWSISNEYLGEWM